MNLEKKRTVTILAFLYGMSMFFLLFLRTPRIRPLPYLVQLREHLNLVPFRVIKNYLRIFTRPANRIFLPYALTNFLGNILLFIPLGFFPPMLLKKMQKFWKTMLLVLGIMVTVEILQMLLLVGTCDVDDIILNAFGASIGYGLLRQLGRVAQIDQGFKGTACFRRDGLGNLVALCRV